MRVINDRPYESRRDFLAIRSFLGQLRDLLPPGQTWSVRRWDGANCHTIEIGLSGTAARRTRIWETDDGNIVALALHEDSHQIHPNVHPKFAYLTSEVLAWAETAARDDGEVCASHLVWDNDITAHKVALSLGYVETKQREVIRSGCFGAWEIPPPDIADGYEIRSVRNDAGDHQLVADLLNAAFGRTIHTAIDHQAFAANAPSYREHTDLAAIASDGSFAAYGAVNVDEANLIGEFEPVGSHPAHRQLGLAKALMLEGMRRASDMGLVGIEVETGDMDPANALYESLPFSDKRIATVWQKDL